MNAGKIIDTDYEFTDGQRLNFMALNAKTRLEVLRCYFEPLDTNALVGLRDRVAGIYADAKRRRLLMHELAMLLEVELRGKRLNGRELAFVLAAGRLHERTIAKAAKVESAAHARRARKADPRKEVALALARDILGKSNVRHTANSLAEELHEVLGVSKRALNDWLKVLF